MKNKHTFIFILVSFFLFSFGLPKHIQKKVNKTIASSFETENFHLKPKTFSAEIQVELPSKFGIQNFFEIIVDDKLVGYAYISAAPSKTDEFDYLVVFDTDLIIVKSKLLVYREDYGGEIGSRRWLKQFIGKTKNDDLRPGDNIVAISGATISVRSMTNAVNDLLRSINILVDKKEL